MNNPFGFDFDAYYDGVNPPQKPVQPGRIKQEEADDDDEDRQEMGPREHYVEAVADSAMQPTTTAVTSGNFRTTQELDQPERDHSEQSRYHLHSQRRRSPSPSPENLRRHDVTRQPQQQPWHQQEHSSPEPVLSRHQYQQESRRRHSSSLSHERIHDSSITAATHRGDMSYQQQQQQQAVKYSTTNGEGQWEAWCRNFNTPLDALGDLFDNCVDACYTAGHDNPTATLATIEVGLALQDGTNGLVLTNTCRGEIKPIATVLEVNTRSKKDLKEQIGENGVGLKQASANLSDLSLVLIKSPSKFSLGILWKDLQKDMMCIPSIEFPNPDYYNGHNHNDSLPSLHDQLLEACTETNPQEIGRAIQKYGAGDLDTGINRLLTHYRA